MKLITQLNIRNPMLLTPEEEIAILRTLTKDDFLGNGSSRAVYSLDDNFVVKVAIAAPGALQNETELNRFREEALIYRHREDRHLASIVAHGLCILIMEKVNPQFPDTYCVREAFSILEKEADPNFIAANPIEHERNAEFYMEEALLRVGIHGKTRELVQANRALLEDYIKRADSLSRLAEYLQEYLDDTYGSTSDNEQNGITADGYVVAYDYGYEPGEDNRDQVSHIGDMMDGGVDVLEQAIINIENDYVPSDDELDEKYEIYHYTNYDDCDEDDSEECESNSAEFEKLLDITSSKKDMGEETTRSN